MPGEVMSAIQEVFPDAAISAAWSLWVFEKPGTLQSAHQLIKYRNHPHYGFKLGRLLGHVIRRAGATLDAVTVIPIHSLRLIERGYNQSTPIAEGVADVLDLPFDAGLLHRTRGTRTQTRLSARRRAENLRGAIGGSENASALKVLVVDDVITSGATMSAAATALIQAGAASVCAASLGFARR